MKVWHLHTVIFVSLLLVTDSSSAERSTVDSKDAQESAEALVREALRAEASGNAVERNRLLRTALEKNSDCGPARWHLGYIRIEDAWLTLSEAADRFGNDPNLTEYHRQRESSAGNPAGELLLARWCQDKGLMDQSRFHWLNVIAYQPNHQEALRSLGMQWYNGLLLPREEIAERKRRDYQAFKNPFQVSPACKRRWERTIANWERVADQGGSELLARMEKDLAADDGDHLIPMVNYLLGVRSRAPKDPDRFRVLSLNWVKILAREPSATKYLAIQAIGHPSADVRRATADELKPRPKKDYVPLLLACARFPAEISVSMLGSAGYASAHFTLEIEGLDADVQLEHSASYRKTIEGGGLFDKNRAPGPGNWIRPAPRTRSTIRPAVWRYLALRSTAEMRVRTEQYNVFAQMINQRVGEALKRVTGEDLEDDPRVWQNWWNQYLCDYYEIAPGQGTGEQDGSQTSLGSQGSQPASGQQRRRPVIQLSSHTHDVQLIQLPRLQKLSCFRGDTPVWTETGPRPIEKIRPGDRVLSQHPTTGELALKVVHEVTKRDPSPMLALSVAGNEIVTTLGHPFWEVGQGWTMAKHLRKGSMLHSVHGPVTVDAIEELPTPKEWYAFAYNLMIDDFHTYFVGTERVLVHHLTFLSILDEGSAKVPGY